MAHWYSNDFHVRQQQQQQQQHQLGHHSGIAYGALPHLGCFMPSPYPAVPYAYSSAPLAVNGTQHVWVPVQINCDAAPYPHFYGQMPYPQGLHSGPQVPYREAPRPATARSSHDGGDPLQMAWPGSPVTAQQSFSLHHQPSHAVLPRQQGSRRAPPNWNTAAPLHPSAPADSLRHSDQPLTPLTHQAAHLTLCDDTASSYGTASPGRLATAAEHHPATSESVQSEEDGTSITHGLRGIHLTMAVDDDEGIVDGVEPAWQWLTLGLLRDVMAQLPPHCRKRCRLVCKRWRATMDVSMQDLTPKHAQVHAMVELFPALTGLDLSGCQNVRNRNLAILSRSRLKMQSLAVGHVSTASYGKPRITNQALQSIAAFMGLQSLVLADCSAITTGGLQQLSALTGLRHLALVRCPRVGDRGMSLLHSLICLTYLALTGCTKVADGSMQCVSAVPSLRAVVLGHTRVQDAGLAMLASLPCLTHLALAAEGITQEGLLALGAVAGLQSLGVSQCSGVTGEDLLRFMPCWPALTRLNFNCLSLTADHVETLVKVAPQLGHLGLPGSPIGVLGLAALAGLSSLRSLSVCVSPNAPQSLTAITHLSHLTALQVQGIPMSPNLAFFIGQLSALQGLDVHGFEGSASTYLAHLHPPALLSLSCCIHLCWLDISHWAVKEPEVSRLLAKLPALQHICLLGCPLTDTDLASLEANFPKISFQKLPKAALWQTQTTSQ